jgi:hypothetical protein
MDTPNIPPDCSPESKPQAAQEPAPEPKPKRPEDYRAEDFLPQSAPLRTQVETQVAFLTQAVVDSSVYASGLFDDAAEPPAPFAKNKPEYQRASRVHEIDLMAKAARATASLIGALGRATRYLEPHSNVTTTYNMGADGKPKGYVMRTFMNLPRTAGENQKSEGSNDGG